MGVGAVLYRSTVPIMVPDRVLSSAVERFGVDPASVRLIPRDGSPDGAVHACRRDETDAFLKIKPVAPDGLPREHDVIELQTTLRGVVRVLTYLPSRTGDLVEGLDGHVATLTQRASGRHVTEHDFAPPFFRAWAGTLGRIHRTTRGWSGGAHLRDPRAEREFFLGLCRDDAMAEAWRDLGDRLEALPTDRDGYGVVHNDLHAGNLLIDPDGGLTVLDFDVAGWHWYACDLATVLAHQLWHLRDRPGDARGFADVVVDAYLAEYPLPPARLADLPLFVRYRLALLVLAMQADLGTTTGPGWLREVRAWVLADETLPGVPTA